MKRPGRQGRILYGVVLAIAVGHALPFVAAEVFETTDTSGLPDISPSVASEVKKLRGNPSLILETTTPSRTIRADAFSNSFPIKSSTVSQPRPSRSRRALLH